MATIDLTATFKKLAFDYAEELNALIRRQTGVDGAGYTPVTERIKSTTRTSKKTGRVSKVKSHTRNRARLVVTGRFNQRAFVGTYDAQSMTILGNPEAYDANVSFNDIVAYNDRESPDLKGKHGSTIKRVGPKLVPRDEKEFLSTKIGATILPTVESEVDKQIESAIDNSIRATINKKTLKM